MIRIYVWLGVCVLLKVSVVFVCNIYPTLSIHSQERDNMTGKKLPDPSRTVYIPERNRVEKFLFYPHLSPTSTVR